MRGWSPKQTHTVTEWTDDGRPSVWITETEPEFDANELESWQALKELEDAICPRCGNFVAICSTPGGVDGLGYFVTQQVCYVTAAHSATDRRVDQMYGKSKPDGNGALMTDGVQLGISLFDDDSDDVLGLGAESPEDQNSNP